MGYRVGAKKMGCHRGEVEVRGLNAGATRRESYVDIGEVKRGVERTESDLVSFVMRLGWPKGREGERESTEYR